MTNYFVKKMYLFEWTAFFLSALGRPTAKLTIRRKSIWIQ